MSASRSPSRTRCELKLHDEKVQFMTASVHGVLYDVMTPDYSDHLKRKLKSTMMKQAPATGDNALAQQVKGLQKRLDKQQQCMGQWWRR